MERTFYADMRYGALVNSDYLLPFFIRSIYRCWTNDKESSGSQGKQEVTAIEKALVDLVFEASLPDDQGVLDALNLPLDDFTERVLERNLPKDFYDASLMEELEGDPGLEHMNYVASTFELLPELVPEELQDLCGSDSSAFDTVQEPSGIGTTYVIPLKYQPSIVQSDKQYLNGDEIINEVRQGIADLGVEVPTDYPLWLCIGALSAVGWKGECWCKLLMGS